jgi:hypothetical protein
MSSDLLQNKEQELFINLLRDEIDTTYRKKKKVVSFANTVAIHYMYVWGYAYNRSRERYWEKFATDRVQFHWRIERIGATLEPVLKKRLI